LLAKGNKIPDQTKSFMAELDQWSDKQVTAPLYDAVMHGPEEVIVDTKQLANELNDAILIR